MGSSTPERGWFILGGVAGPRDLIGYFSSDCRGAESTVFIKVGTSPVTTRMAVCKTLTRSEHGICLLDLLLLLLLRSTFTSLHIRH
jgi:hypothetical protein